MGNHALALEMQAWCLQIPGSQHESRIAEPSMPEAFKRFLPALSQRGPLTLAATCEWQRQQRDHPTCRLIFEPFPSLGTACGRDRRGRAGRLCAQLARVALGRANLLNEPQTLVRAAPRALAAVEQLELTLSSSQARVHAMRARA